MSLAPNSSKSKFTPKQVAAFYFKPLLTEDVDPTGLQACKARHSTPRADIVHSPAFESAMVKVLAGKAKRVSRPGRAALQSFLRVESTAEEATDEAELSKIGFADRMLKKRRIVLRYERNRITPLTLEMILFVKVNVSYWDMTTVDACI
ncbi:hypothetical protein PHMEG_00028994 [Phytophthora megakarya]|uniref:Uncharacterized protein n=1 Tax=Phytophthora megakarya TaxID=4795 RepID=A0A225V4B3_9STRA|nr:hypothetical protein PHMEG_00028994 [Phytophthora megakarya]